MNIVIALNSRKDVFDRTIYAQSLAGEPDTVNEINKVLTEIEQEIQKAHKKVIIMGIAFYIFLFLLFGLLLYIGGWGGISTGKALLLVFGGVSMIIGSVYRIVRKATQVEESLKLLASEIVKKKNESFNQTGLRWTIPANFPNSIGLYVNLGIAGRRQNLEPNILDSEREPLRENIQVVVEDNSNNNTSYQPPSMFG